MSGLLNRFKHRKGGTNNENESITVSPSFDEEGFLCPQCHQKFPDSTQLAQHFANTHNAESTVVKKDINTTEQKDEIQKNSMEEIALWKQQFTVSEESRMLLSNELIREKQRANDFEEELHLIQKHLKTTQSKVAEQSQEIANFKATKDVYDAQLTIFSNELLTTQNLLKEKQQHIDSLTLKLSNDDDVHVLQRELITIQQHMHEISIEKEEQIEKLRSVLKENYQYSQKLDQIGTIFNQNLSIYDEMISKNTLQIQSEINQNKKLIREQVKNVIKSMRNHLIENQTQIVQLKKTNIQLNHDLEQQILSNDKLINDLQKQTNSSRNEIEILNKEIHQLETNLNELKEEKNQLIESKMNGDQNDERQNLVRQITIEKNQFEQQIKEFRIQIKQISNERQQIQNEFDQISKQFSLISNEKSQLTNEINSLKNQLNDNNKDKERRINELNRELSTIREQYTNIKNNHREINELNNNQKSDLERLKTDLTEQINRLIQEKNELQQTIHSQEQITIQTKIELTTIQKEKDKIVQQLQTTLAQLHSKLDEREARIKRLKFGIHRSTTVACRTHQYIQQNIHVKQLNILTTIQKAKEDSQLIRIQTREQIQEEFTNYLLIIHRIILDSKNVLEKQIEKENLNIIEQQEQIKKIKDNYEKLLEEYREQKQKLEIQLGDMNKKLLQVSKSLSESTQTIDRQREKYEKQITSFERELESRTKRHEMQLAALTENLATVRSELKLNNEKLASIDQIKAEKADIEGRLVVSQDERRALLERSLANENKNEKLIADNGQLMKKSTDLEAALQEIAREYQVLQIQANKLSQRRWLDDEDVDDCMKCHQTFSVRQRKHHCRNCGNIFCDNCSSKTATIAASSKKKRVCDQCYKDLTS